MRDVPDESRDEHHGLPTQVERERSLQLHDGYFAGIERLQAIERTIFWKQLKPAEKKCKTLLCTRLHLKVEAMLVQHRGKLEDDDADDQEQNHW